MILTMEELKHFRKSTLKGEKRNGHHLEKEALQFGTRYRTMWYSVEEGKAGGLGEEGSGEKAWPEPRLEGRSRPGRRTAGRREALAAGAQPEQGPGSGRSLWSPGLRG